MREADQTSDVPDPAGNPAGEPSGGGSGADPASRPVEKQPPQNGQQKAENAVDLTKYDAETVLLVNELEEDATRLEGEYLVLAERSKAAKKLLEAKAAELLDLIRSRRDNRGKPPAPRQLTIDDVPAGQAAEAVPGPDPLAELWREYPLDRWAPFGLKPRDVKALAEARLYTVGDLANYSTPDPNNPEWTKRLTDIDGIGQATADRISEADSLFWAEWNRGLRDKFATEKGVAREAAAGPGAEGAGDGNAGADGEGSDPD